MLTTAILCNSFEGVRYAFSDFMDFLETFDPFLISKVYEYSYAIETVEDIRYIFIDYRFEPMFKRMKDTMLIGSDEFFEDFGSGYLPKGVLYG